MKQPKVSILSFLILSALAAQAQAAGISCKVSDSGSETYYFTTPQKDPETGSIEIVRSESYLLPKTEAGSLPETAYFLPPMQMGKYTLYFRLNYSAPTQNSSSGFVEISLDTVKKVGEAPRPVAATVVQAKGLQDVNQIYFGFTNPNNPKQLETLVCNSDQ